MPAINITPFAFGDNMVRAHVDEYGNPWFVAKDVAAILEIQNIRQNMDGLGEDEKGVSTVYTPSGAQEMLILSESGLYALVFRSRKPEAKAFSKWVRSELLPTLRKTGSYAMPAASPKPPAIPAAEPAPSRTPVLPNIDLPDEALHLRPAVRLRLWQDSLQAARLEGAGMAYAVECFARLCVIMSKMPQVRESPFRRDIQAFISQCCHTVPGARASADALYQAFRRWGRDSGCDSLPSKKIFGETIGYFFSKFKSNGIWYRDVSLVPPVK